MQSTERIDQLVGLIREYSNESIIALLRLREFPGDEQASKTLASMQQMLTLCKAELQALQTAAAGLDKPVGKARKRGVRVKKKSSDIITA
jgi:hypothetical protein